MTIKDTKTYLMPYSDFFPFKNILIKLSNLHVYIAAANIVHEPNKINCRLCYHSKEDIHEIWSNKKARMVITWSHEIEIFILNFFVYFFLEWVSEWERWPWNERFDLFGLVVCIVEARKRMSEWERGKWLHVVAYVTFNLPAKRASINSSDLT